MKLTTLLILLLLGACTSVPSIFSMTDAWCAKHRAAHTNRCPQLEKAKS